MFRPLAVCIGLRYARSRRSFISFVSGLSLAGLALSVAILLFVQAVIAGFEREVRERVLGVVPHVTVAGRTPIADEGDVLAAIRRTAGVVAASGVVEGAALLATSERTLGVALVGVVPQSYRDVSGLFDFAGGEPLEEGRFRLLIGAEAGRRLGVGVGDDLTVVLPQAVVTPFGALARQKRFEVAGMFATDSQLDSHAAYLHRADAARLFRLGAAVHGFHVRVADPLAASAVRERLVGAIGVRDYVVGTWRRTLGGVYDAIGVTKGMLYLLLSMLVAVAAFNLVSSLVMIVNERRGDVAMLRTIGSRAGLVLGAFVVLGVSIAAVGVGLGIGAGLLLGAVAEAGFPWLERVLGTSLMGEYLVTRLPMRFVLADIGNVAATALALCLAATIFPAWRATRLQPAQVLAHE